MLFLRIIACLTANKEVLVASGANTDWQLTAKDNNTLRLSFYSNRDSHNVTDNNVAVFEKAGPNLYKIRLGLHKYVFGKKNDPGVVAIEDDDPLVGKEGNEGFLWEAKGDDKKVQFKSRNKCLEIKGMDQTNKNKYLNLMPCDNKKLAQDFEILDANIKGKDPKTDEPAKEEAKPTKKKKPEEEPSSEKPSDKPKMEDPSDKPKTEEPLDKPKVEEPSGEKPELNISQPVSKKKDLTADEHKNGIPGKFRCHTVQKRPKISRKIKITNGNN